MSQSKKPTSYWLSDSDYVTIRRIRDITGLSASDVVRMATQAYLMQIQRERGLAVSVPQGGGTDA